MSGPYRGPPPPTSMHGYHRGPPPPGMHRQHPGPPPPTVHRQSRGPPPPQTANREMTVKTNLFGVKGFPKAVFHQYDEFQPLLKSRLRRIELVHHLQVQVDPTTFTPLALYDGASIMYSYKELRLPGRDVGIYDIGKRKIRVSKVNAAPLEFDALRLLLEEGDASDRAQKEINVLQLLLKQAPDQAYINIGRKYFSPDNATDLPGGVVQLLQGFFHSIKPIPSRMVVNVDTCVAPFLKPGPLLDSCLSTLQKRDARALASPQLTSDEFRKLSSIYEGARVRITYRKTRYIDRVLKHFVRDAGLFPFDIDGRRTNVARYWNDVHGLTIRYPSIVGISISPKGADNPAIIPLECCEILPGQPFRPQLSASHAQVMVQKASLRPADKLAMIVRGSTRGAPSQTAPLVQYRQSPYLQQVGLEVDQEPMQVAGVLLPASRLNYGNGDVFTPINGAWNMKDRNRSRRFYEGGRLDKWIVVNYDTDVSDEDLLSWLKELKKCCSDLGMVLERPLTVQRGSPQAPDKILEDLFKDQELGVKLRAQSSDGKFITDSKGKIIIRPPQLVLVILPEEAADVRIAVKIWGDTKRGIPTQCVRNTKDGLRTQNQYLNNVAIKLNLRANATNFKTDLFARPFFATRKNERWMVIGIDVTHPGPGVKNRPSIVSSVFSTNDGATAYRARLCVQRPRVEQIEDNDLTTMVKVDALTMFVSTALRTRAKGDPRLPYPLDIVVYRDGVSEGEYDKVANHEFKVIRDAILELVQSKTEDIPDPQLPRMTFVVVTKRHHVRFFPMDPSEADRSGNCAAGFVTKDSLAPDRREFFLLSHAGIIGTSRPSHYIVIHDEIFHDSPEELKIFSYGLCHVYAKATRSVSIPTPIYYADLACARAVHFFREEAASSVGDTERDFDIDDWKRRFLPVLDWNNAHFFL